MPTRCNRWYLLQILLLAQHVSGTIMPIIRSSRVLYWWSLPVVLGALVFKLSVWCGAEGYVSGLQAAALKQQPAYRMMGIMVPETCWASNKICNKYHLLHLVLILFPHINDDARSESLQICIKINLPSVIQLHTNHSKQCYNVIRITPFTNKDSAVFTCFSRRFRTVPAAERKWFLQTPLTKLSL